jgi:hypothetical protein
MKEVTVKTVELGFSRSPALVAEEIERVTAAMQRDGFRYRGSRTEEHLRQIQLTFEREIDLT